MALKLTLTKGAQVWVADVAGATVTYTWGKADGKQQVQEDAYTEGKQKRTKQQQARFEALAAAKKKVRLGYSVSAAEGLAADEAAEFAAAEVAFHASPAPMLALDLDAKRKAKLPPAVKKYVQKKLDGRRCLANLDTGALFSRGRKPMESLPHIAAAVRALRAFFPPDVTWLDGEVYAHGLGFQTVTSLATGSSHTTKGDVGALRYHVYDVVSQLPFSKRLELLTKAGLPDDDACAAEGDVVVLVKTHAVALDADMDALHAKYVNAGYEGTILRIDGVGYEEDKRSPSLLKRKDWQQEEFTVVGFLKEEHADTLGSVLLASDAGVQFAATPSVSDDDKRAIWEHQDVYLHQRATVKFFEKHESGVPRFPVLLGFRDAGDLSPSEPKGKDKVKGKGAVEAESESDGSESPPVRAKGKGKDKGKDTHIGAKRSRAEVDVEEEEEDEPARVSKPERAKKVSTRVKAAAPEVDAAAEATKAKAAAEAKTKIEAIQAEAATTLMPVLLKKKAPAPAPAPLPEPAEEGKSKSKPKHAKKAKVEESDGHIATYCVSAWIKTGHCIRIAWPSADDEATAAADGYSAAIPIVQGWLDKRHPHELVSPSITGFIEPAGGHDRDAEDTLLLVPEPTAAEPKAVAKAAAEPKAVAKAGTKAVTKAVADLKTAAKTGDHDKALAKAVAEIKEATKASAETKEAAKAEGYAVTYGVRTWNEAAGEDESTGGRTRYVRLAWPSAEAEATAADDGYESVIALVQRWLDAHHPGELVITSGDGDIEPAGEHKKAEDTLHVHVPVKKAKAKRQRVA